MSEKITIDGKTYQAEPESCECDGCAGNCLYELCARLPDCKDIIFIEVEDPK